MGISQRNNQMNNPKNRYLVNRKQANVSIDQKARIHKLTTPQPKMCQIDEINDGIVFDTEQAAIDYCSAHNLDYKRCSHCFGNTNPVI